MDIAEKKRRIDARWDEINPQYSFTKKERGELPYLLADDELPERILVGTPSGSFFQNVLVVATDRQVLHITTKETLRLAYADIESARMEGAEVNIIGEHRTMSFISPDEEGAKRLVAYVDSVRAHSDSSVPQQPTGYQRPATPPLSDAGPADGSQDSTSNQKPEPQSAPKWAWAVGISLFLLLLAVIIFLLTDSNWTCESAYREISRVGDPNQDGLVPVGDMVAAARRLANTDAWGFWVANCI